MKTRREFLADVGKAAGGVMLAQLALPLLEGCLPTSAPLVPKANSNPVGPDGRVAVDVSDLSATNPAKVATDVTAPDGFGVMVTRISDTDFRALSMRCTHANCPVDSRLSNGDIHCSCHNSLFALDGSVVQQPATVPLDTYSLTLDATAKVVHVKLTK